MNWQAFKLENEKAHQGVEMIDIGYQMKRDNLPDDFVFAAVKVAFENEGVADLMTLWRDEPDQNERNEIVADIQELIDDIKNQDNPTYPSIKLNDLDAISKDIRAFKDSLLQVVNEQGGITKLAELTGIPQPSLSRFFNSNAMPRRTTLMKIAKALNRRDIQLDQFWAERRAG